MIDAHKIADRKLWRRGAPLKRKLRLRTKVTILVCAISVMSLALVLRFGNPQASKYIYIFQAYYSPGGRSLPFAPDTIDLFAIDPPEHYTGIWRQWYENGQLASEAVCENGKVTRCKSWKNDGELYDEWQYDLK